MTLQVAFSNDKSDKSGFGIDARNGAFGIVPDELEGASPLPEQTAIVAQVERLLGLVGHLAAGQRVQAEGLLQAALREAMGNVV